MTQRQEVATPPELCKVCGAYFACPLLRAHDDCLLGDPTAPLSEESMRHLREIFLDTKPTPRTTALLGLVLMPEDWPTHVDNLTTLCGQLERENVQLREALHKCALLLPERAGKPFLVLASLKEPT